MGGANDVRDTLPRNGDEHASRAPGGRARALAALDCVAWAGGILIGALLLRVDLPGTSLAWDNPNDRPRV